MKRIEKKKKKERKNGACTTDGRPLVNINYDVPF